MPSNPTPNCNKHSPACSDLGHLCLILCLLLGRAAETINNPACSMLVTSSLWIIQFLGASWSYRLLIPQHGAEFASPTASLITSPRKFQHNIFCSGTFSLSGTGFEKAPAKSCFYTHIKYCQFSLNMFLTCPNPIWFGTRNFPNGLQRC